MQKSYWLNHLIDWIEIQPYNIDRPYGTFKSEVLQYEIIPSEFYNNLANLNSTIVFKTNRLILA